MPDAWTQNISQPAAARVVPSVLVLVPLLWAGGSMVCWRFPASACLSPSLAWLSEGACAASFLIFWSRGQADGPTIAAHTVMVGGLLIPLLEIMR